MTREIAPQAQEVLSFWFEELEPKDWFMGGERVDNMLRERFLSLMGSVKSGACDFWSETLEGRRALIIVCDQFSRNIFRGTKESFALDEKARGLVAESLKKGGLFGEAENLSLSEKMFFFMPLMHSEDSTDQELSVKIFEAMGSEQSLKEAKQHYDIIARFGRYPHRNKALGRENTAEENEYLSASDTKLYGVESSK